MANHRTLFGISGNDRGAVISCGDGFLADVEPQLPAAVLGILAVAEEAVFGKDGADVAVETERFRSDSRRQCQ